MNSYLKQIVALVTLWIITIGINAVTPNFRWRRSMANDSRE